MSEVDLLAIMAHPDDAELLCGGTLARAVDAGYRVGVLDLTRGESGTWGSSDGRAREAQAAADILGLTVRANAGLPDAALENTSERSEERRVGKSVGDGGSRTNQTKKASIARGAELYTA